MPDDPSPTLPPGASHALFEVSWEVCNKVGGIHTVVSSKAKTLVERFGDDYVTVGPWTLAENGAAAPFDEEPGFEAFAEACRQQGVPVRVGRWRIPGRPRTILVEFSGLLADRDAYLTRLWEEHQVESLFGDWDYVEPVMFGRAAGRVIEAWYRRHVLPRGLPAVLHAHEWMAGTALLHVRAHAPRIGTVFTTHATMLGRALASTGRPPLDALDGRTPEEAARAVGVSAKHSLEGVTARTADVFTTVGTLTAQEAEAFHRRRPDPVLPNGLDPVVIAEVAGPCPAAEVRQRLQGLAARFLGTDVEDALLVGSSGRYEFHNKGYDVLLEALAVLERQPGRGVVAFLFVPAGASGPRLEMVEGPTGVNAARREPSVVSTHHLFDPEGDPIQAACARLGLDNAPSRRVRVIHVPIYLDAHDGVLDLPYEAVLRGLDLTLFPSFYEPWGLTPQESMAMGVPTVSTDMAGFGAWMRDGGVGAHEGLTVIDRVGHPLEAVIGAIADALQAFTAAPPPREGMATRCRAAVERLAWSRLAPRFLAAFEDARALGAARAEGSAPPSPAWVPAPPAAPRPSPASGPTLHPFDVAGPLPPALAALEALARNYHWTWDPEAAALFAAMAPDAWEQAGHNPVRFLRDLARAGGRLELPPEELARRVARLRDRLRASLEAPTDAPAEAAGLSAQRPVAYFCAEFGIESTLQTYTGGLGILAGDHLKSASDLGLPLVGVGLFYHRGYLRQRVSREGEQIWSPASNDPRGHALDLVTDERGEPLEVALRLPGGRVVLQVWRANVGRVPLYLLDADLPANRAEDRDITHFIYGGDEEMRLRQEIVLGRGGVRLLRALGIRPAAVHLNEGHAAFAPLERIAQLVRERGLTFEEAREVVRADTVFTTHTGVAAGHDRFGESLMRRYFANVDAWLGLPWGSFLALGASREAPETFSMTHLALRCAGFVNGVSRIHGDVSRALLRSAWPALLPDEIPIHHVTNGVHLATWTAPEIGRLVRPDGDIVRGSDFAERAASIGLEALWDARRAARDRLRAAMRTRLRAAMTERGDARPRIQQVLGGIEEDALWIGFARRFAGYKRGDLLLRHPKRLQKLLANADRPVRLVYAGKVHPRDGQGQQILQTVARAALGEDLAGRVFFLEDYDIELARFLVQGVDVWLNTPTRPLEASGTSGMKAAANGVLNLSVLDGWWAEGYDGTNGWAITGGDAARDPETADDLDADDLLRLIEGEIAPLFFDRDAAGVPQRWLERARRGLETLPPTYCTRRMLREYRDGAYLPAAARGRADRDEDHRSVRARVAASRRLRRGFERLRVLEVDVPALDGLAAGDTLSARVRVDLAGLGPEDVAVDLLLAGPGEALRPEDARRVPLAAEPSSPSGDQHYVASVLVREPGSHAWGLRIRLRTPDGPTPELCEQVLWL